MAKADNVQKGKAGRGWRFHESCGYSTKGYRSKTCGHCGEDFPTSATATTTAPRRANVGGFSSMLETLAAVKEFTKEAGGVESALEWINQIETLAGDCGGMDELRQAIQLTAKL